MTAIYEIKNVNHIYGQGRKVVEALIDVNLDIFAGQRLGIVGESGSGKTTLSRLMVGLDRPRSGQILFDGQRIDNVSERNLGFLYSRVQMIFQDPRSSLDPRMKIGKSIVEPLCSPLLKHRTNVPNNHKERLVEVLHRVGLATEIADRYPHELSGGQRQRVAIARALVSAPDVLVADEPVSALDVSVRAQVLNLLRDLVVQSKKTLIFVSHDLTVVRHICDVVIVLKQGKIVEHGNISQIYQNPQHPYTKELLSAIPSM